MLPFEHGAMTSFFVGYLLGKNKSTPKEKRESDDQRQVALKALVELLKSTEQLTTDVDTHNTRIQKVHRHVGDLKVSGEMEEIQQTPLELFDELDEGDVLFIDSSHTVKTGGDVPWLFEEVIPRLSPGVVVHVHDAFLPGNYPPYWVFEGRGWNEIHLLHAFLSFNSEFRIMLGVHYLACFRPKALIGAFDQLAELNVYDGGSLWFRRRRRWTRIV